MNDELKAGVGLSRMWKAREAGREVAETVLEKLDGEKPKFFLLFSTIHYEKHGGFEELLKGVWDILPEETPLIGGTVAGFINRYGCYTRGVTSLAVAHSQMDAAAGIGFNTKRDPKKAVKNCAEMIKKGLNSSSYTNKFLFELVSGGKIPQFPGMGRRRVIKSGVTSKMATKLSNISLTTLQYGVGREEEILDELTKHFPDYTIIGGSSIDGNNMIENYQFLGREIYTNAIVAIGVKTNFEIGINTTYGLKKTDIKLNITKKSNYDRVIHEIDGMPASDGFLKKISWPYDFIDERLYRRTFFTPLGYWMDDVLFPNVVGLFLGKDIQCGYRIEKNELYLLSASGESLINAVDENLKKFENRKNELGIIVSCAARLETLGKNIFKVREKLVDFFGEKEFILIYTGGEDTYSRDHTKRHINESFNVAVLSS